MRGGYRVSSPDLGPDSSLKGLVYMRLTAAVAWISAILWWGWGHPTQAGTALYGQDALRPLDPQTEQLLENRLYARSLPLRQDGTRGLQRQRLAGEKAPTSLNAIVLMCDFADSLMFGRHGLVPGEFPPALQSDRYYAAHDSLFFDHLLGKVADYYTTVSGNKLTLNYSVHPRTVNLPEPMAFYGNHPDLGEQPILMAEQVVNALADEIDFSAFDTYILVHAGAGEETDILGNSPEQIFSTYLDPDDFAAAVADSLLEVPYLTAPGFAAGTGIDRVLILPETEQQDAFGSFGGGFGSLGVYCFEVGLHLGMLSLSDFTPSGRPDSQGIGQYGLMGFGLFTGLGFIPPHPCAYNKMLMGWLEPYDAVVGAPGRYALTPAEAPADPLACARVNITGQEFWLLEYRLQDPNGDRRYTFADDKNGNGTPDFFDMDSTAGDGTPTGKFDPAADAVERVIDAEWDFAMSENNARRFGELGWGSGVYIWHIDEGVVQDVVDAPRNLFNADPRRKAVDLEEADGIQDLDSSEPSDFLLGGDDDAFRGEFASDFLPTTRPRTDTAGGAYTGIAFRDFSNVVLDSLRTLLFTDGNGVEYWGFQYADTMTFSLQSLPGSPTAPILHASRDLPAGTDLRGSHLLVGDLDLQGGTDEIILAGHAGEVFVLDGDLNEFLDLDADPTTLAPFVVGRRDGQPARWNLPPALGDVDGDLEPEIILTGSEGLFAFNADGTSVLNGSVETFGLFADVPGCSLPPVLVPVDVGATQAEPDEPVQALVVEQGPGGARLVFVSGPEATAGVVDLGARIVPTPPVLIADFVVTALVDTTDGAHALHVMERVPGPLPVAPLMREIALAGPPGALPLIAGRAPDSAAEEPLYYVAVIDTAGHGETVFFDRALMTPRAALLWPTERVISSPLGLGGAFVGADLLGRVGHGGDWLPGWPRRPGSAGLAAGPLWQGTPLVAQLVGSSAPLDQFIFPTRDGRLFATNAQGAAISDWPLAGPGASSGTPALGNLVGSPDADLVVAGTFDRITGTSGDGGFTSMPLSTLSVWRDVAAADPIWPMFGGSIWRNGTFAADTWHSGPVTAPGTGLVPGSHYCYPSPLGAGPLKVSGQVRSPARAMVVVYNLEGELVRESAWREVGAVDPFVIEIELPQAVTGLYLSRLVVETPGTGTENSVTQFAIVR